MVLVEIVVAVLVVVLVLTIVVAVVVRRTVLVLVVLVIVGSRQCCQSARTRDTEISKVEDVTPSHPTESWVPDSSTLGHRRLARLGASCIAS